jgi:hypothetical protein
MSAENDEFFNKPYEAVELKGDKKIKTYLEEALEKSPRKWVYLSTLWGKRKLYVVHTVGFYNLGLPEILIMGNNEPCCQGYLDLCALCQYAHNKKNDHFSRMEHVLMPTPAMIVDIGKKSKSHFLRKLSVYCGGWNFEAQQMIISDEKGSFPWEKEFNDKYKSFQFPLIE